MSFFSKLFKRRKTENASELIDNSKIKSKIHFVGKSKPALDTDLETENASQSIDKSEIYSRIRTELHVKDYRRAAGWYEQIKEYKSAITMFQTQISIDLEKAEYIQAYNDLNKLIEIVEEYPELKDTKAITEYIKKMKPIINGKKELWDKLDKNFR